MVNIKKFSISDGYQNLAQTKNSKRGKTRKNLEKHGKTDQNQAVVGHFPQAVTGAMPFCRQAESGSLFEAWLIFSAKDRAVLGVRKALDLLIVLMLKWIMSWVKNTIEYITKNMVFGLLFIFGPHPVPRHALWAWTVACWRKGHWRLTGKAFEILKKHLVF